MKPAPGLTREEMIFLLRLAREIIACRCRGEEPPHHPVTYKTLTEKRGVFVSLYAGDDLRGCIGYVEGIKPLQQAVTDMAGAAAFEDPRFPPVSEDELEQLRIEISVLSRLREIKDIREIEVGKHGLFIRKSVFSGLLLPQVAADWGWDRETFLSQTCRKAGLPSGEWKTGTCEIYSFTADIFSETDPV